MAAKRVSAEEPDQSGRRVASTPEGRENQLVSLAMDLAEKQLRNGTASAQVTSHFLKAGSSREYLERQRLAMDVELMNAKKEQMDKLANIEQLYSDAISAMRKYQGDVVVEEGEDYDT